MGAGEGGVGGGESTWLQVRVSSSRQYRSSTLPAPVLPPNSHRRRPSSLLLRLAPMRALGGSMLHSTHAHLHAWTHHWSSALHGGASISQSQLTLLLSYAHGYLHLLASSCKNLELKEIFSLHVTWCMCQDIDDQNGKLCRNAPSTA